MQARGEVGLLGLVPPSQPTEPAASARAPVRQCRRLREIVTVLWLSGFGGSSTPWACVLLCCRRQDRSQVIAGHPPVRDVR